MGRISSPSETFSVGVAYVTELIARLTSSLWIASQTAPSMLTFLMTTRWQRSFRRWGFTDHRSICRPESSNSTRSGYSAASLPLRDALIAVEKYTCGMVTISGLDEWVRVLGGDAVVNLSGCQ